MIQLFLEILVSALLIIGGLFGLIGAWALVRLPDPMTRLHGPTKSATLGVGGVLLASLASFSAFHIGTSWHELLITLFLFMTAPITGLMIARTHMARHWKATELPAPAGKGSEWAIYATDPTPADSKTGH